MYIYEQAGEKVDAGKITKILHRHGGAGTQAPPLPLPVLTGHVSSFSPVLTGHDSLHEQGFTEIHTPKLIPGESEGGAEVFRTDYFGKSACLAQSPQVCRRPGPRAHAVSCMRC